MERSAGARPAADVAIDILEGYGERDWDRARSVLTSDSEVLEVPTGERWVGPEGVIAELERWAAGFSDSHSEFLNVFERGRFVCVEAIWKGTHDGDLVLPELTLPASGKPLAFPYCTVAEIDDGKQTRSKHYYDVETISEQLQLDS